MSVPLSALLPLIAVAVAFDLYCLWDLRHSRVQYLPKWGWVLVILFISSPLGGIAYLAAGKQPG